MTEIRKKGETQKPDWLKVKVRLDGHYLEVQSLLKKHNLHTVCQEANCPNRGECFSSGTATFLIMGPNCTRRCRFCNVTGGAVGQLDRDEPQRVAETVKIMKLKHAVVTSVTRDDLPDGGAGHFAEVIRAIRARCPGTTIEVLTPDFKGSLPALNAVFAERPEVFNHNLETVKRLYPEVRPQAVYDRSLAVLAAARAFGDMVVKSGLMVGLGETVEELADAFDDLAHAGVESLTIGQYLAPSKNHHPVVKYYHPDEFSSLAVVATRAGIRQVFADPLVRSSYHAGEQYSA
jgi:lipoic acid synthetase